MDKNLWILTEENPRKEVIAYILQRFSTDIKTPCFIDTLRILPILDKDRKFSFLYEVIGFRSNKINKVFVKLVSGYSSFVDFLIFYQAEQPKEGERPLYAIEETKTDDSESRNTGVYQRASKFVYIEYYYPKIKKIMYYNLKIPQKEKPTQTNILGTRCLLTIGAEIIGKKLDPKIFQPFRSVDEIVKFKSKMRKAPKGNIPITIIKNEKKILISGRLYKDDNLAHDPNMGALSLICDTLRILEWKGEIIITNHGLSQKHLRPANKFVKIANMLDVKMEGLNLPKSVNGEHYWKYEKEGEKLGTIFIQLVVENFAQGKAIFENHAGCEKGYFITADGKPIPLAKYSDKALYKKGDKTKIISIPDLILIDLERSEVINVEGKRYQFRLKGIEELNGYGDIERLYINKYYPKYGIVRTVVLYGGKDEIIVEIEVGFLLNENGGLVLGVKAPSIFKDAIKNLIDFWYA